MSEIVIDAFQNYLNDLDTFFMLLSTEYNVDLYNRESIIIFDEIQRFPKARQSIKKLVNDGRYDYIETGSLISVKENVKDITIPSEERQIKMYPLDLEEFLWALNEEKMVDYIKKCFYEKKPLEERMHNKAMLLFKQYMIVGGMPQSIVAYLSNQKNFKKADIEKRDILTLYRNDIMKIKNKYQSKVLSIFDQIPTFLSQHEKRVVLSKILSNATYDNFYETFFWLSDSMMVNECFNCLDPNVGLSLNEDRTFVKCYMGDTGLLISHAFDENEMIDNDLYKKIVQGQLSINEGMLYENAISQMLVSNGHKLYFYTHYNKDLHRNDIEIDFLISNKSKTKYKVFPIEVKSKNKYSIKSLEKFIDKFNDRVGNAYVIHPKNLQMSDKIIYIPAYMTMCL